MFCLTGRRILGEFPFCLFDMFCLRFMNLMKCKLLPDDKVRGGGTQMILLDVEHATTY